MRQYDRFINNLTLDGERLFRARDSPYSKNSTLTTKK